MKLRTVEIEIVSVILDVSALIFTSCHILGVLRPHTMLQLTEEEKMTNIKFATETKSSENNYINL